MKTWEFMVRDGVGKRHASARFTCIGIECPVGDF